jgi:hypothetical protein
MGDWEKEDLALRTRAAAVVFGDDDRESWPTHVVDWVRTGRLPAETLHRSLLPMVLRAHAALEKLRLTG